MRFFTESERLEAFSDGVLAVIITIMVLEIRPPSGATFAAILEAAPGVGLYALSFVFIGIYWNNHHHMLRASKGIDGASMWANLHLLFWLSLVPFSTQWLGAHFGAVAPTALYATIFLLCAIAWSILQWFLQRLNGPDTPFARAVAADVKGKSSIVLYMIAIALAFVLPLASYALLVIVATMWFVPDRRFEALIDR